MTIYSNLSGLSYSEIEKKYEGLGYKEFKEDLAEIVGSTLEKIQTKYYEIIKSPELDRILDEGRDFAYSIARKKLSKVYKRIGLGRN